MHREFRNPICLDYFCHIFWKIVQPGGKCYTHYRNINHTTTIPLLDGVIHCFTYNFTSTITGPSSAVLTCICSSSPPRPDGCTANQSSRFLESKQNSTTTINITFSLGFLLFFPRGFYCSARYTPQLIHTILVVRVPETSGISMKMAS